MLDGSSAQGGSYLAPAYIGRSVSDFALYPKAHSCENVTEVKKRHWLQIARTFSIQRVKY